MRCNVQFFGLPRDVVPATVESYRYILQLAIRYRSVRVLEHLCFPFLRDGDI